MKNNEVMREIIIIRFLRGRGDWRVIKNGKKASFTQFRYRSGVSVVGMMEKMSCKSEF